MATSPLLTEYTRDLVSDHIKANIATSLANVRADRADKIVSTEPPRSYFIYDGANTYQCPAIFTVVDSFTVPDEVTGNNFVDAVVKLFVSAVVEDRDAALLTVKVERYQSALFALLHRITLEDQPKNLKIYTRVLSAAFSPLYTKNKDGEGIFRKEASMELEVKHWENPLLF